MKKSRNFHVHAELYLIYFIDKTSDMYLITMKQLYTLQYYLVIMEKQLSENKSEIFLLKKIIKP